MSDGEKFLDERAAEQAGGHDDCTDERASIWPEPLDLQELARQEPEPPAMIIDDWLPCGYATLLAGHGGIGKSGIALHLAACIAMGIDFFGVPVQRRRVLYLSCEDRSRVLHWRLWRISRYLGLSLDALDGHLDVLDLVGRDTVLWERDPQTGITLTAAYAALHRRLIDSGTEVLLVDGVADTYGGNENSRTEVKRYVNALVSLLDPDRGAVVLIGHTNKLTAKSATAEGYSGSTGWHNSVRARWYLYPETQQDEDGTLAETGELSLDLQKSNLGRADQSMTFAWDNEAMTYVGRSVSGISHFERREREREEQDGILAALRTCTQDDYVPAATTGRRTAYHVLSASELFPESLSTKAGTRRFWRHIEALRRMGAICEGSIRRADRKKTVTLELTEYGHRRVAANAANHQDSIGSGYAASRSAANAANAAGGYRGGARTPDHDGEERL